MENGKIAIVHSLTDEPLAFATTEFHTASRGFIRISFAGSFLPITYDQAQSHSRICLRSSIRQAVLKMPRVILDKFWAATSMCLSHPFRNNAVSSRSSMRHDRLRRLRAEANAKADRILPALLVRALGSPANWGSDPSCCPLGEFVDPVSGATPSKKTERFWSGDVPWVSPKDMKRDFVSESQDHVSQAALDETNLSLVKQGNTLIVVRGMILARDIPVAINRNPVTINQDMKALIPKAKEITGAYIWAALRLAKQKLQMLVRTAGHGHAHSSIPRDSICNFPIPLPNPG